MTFVAKAQSVTCDQQTVLRGLLTVPSTWKDQGPTAGVPRLPRRACRRERVGAHLAAFLARRMESLCTPLSRTQRFYPPGEERPDVKLLIII